MLLGLLGFTVGCIAGAVAAIFCISMVTAGKDEENARKWERFEDDLK